jgi:predicted GNAT superfamily acetyltransferase
MMPIIYRILSTIEELEAVCDLEYEIWGREMTAATPAVVMKVTIAHGGVAVGAMDGERMIGMAWALAVPRPEGPLAGQSASQLALWSHITGVLPEYRSAGVGLGLKSAQRDWALANGYTTMHWTFDPMQARNARFNFRMLGAVVRRYKPNFYGIMRNKLNPGLPSDRFEATWHMAGDRVARALSGALAPAVEQLPEAAMLVRLVDGEPTLHLPSSFDQPHYGVEIPLNYVELMATRPDLGADWQAKLRAAMLAAIDAGYVVVDFARTDTACWHVLARHVVDG